MKVGRTPALILTLLLVLAFFAMAFGIASAEPPGPGSKQCAPGQNNIGGGPGNSGPGDKNGAPLKIKPCKR
jgi:hypothetical protein